MPRSTNQADSTTFALPLVCANPVSHPRYNGTSDVACIHDPTENLPDPTNSCMKVGEGIEGPAMTKRMVAELAKIAARHTTEPRIPTAIPRLTIWQSPLPTLPKQAMFDPKFYVLVQGAKRLTIVGKAFEFSVGSCAVSSVGLPFTSQIIEASPEVPYIGLELGLDATIVASLLLEMPAFDEKNDPAFMVSNVVDEIAEPLDRLVALLARPADIPVLGPQYERELYYRLLQSPMGATLRQIVQHNSRFHQIKAAVEWICSNAHETLRVEELAVSVGMSVTSFHRYFKNVTAYSPLSYQRHIRLLDGRGLVASGAKNVTNAGFAVGYASSSQFSREYKRMFGVSPIHDAPALP